ncbi:aminopeptidase PepB [Agaribacter marinus]|uniref:Aminopeptidase n=1 Tax=Agaribacter marinus TaxID=1431249 RepID=A0AA37WJL0_9ALTE|nr:aminopeptidase PepB [Agaribacter marinus]GLR72363.1 aminopeptidase [Agaribacter marinus]
MLTLDIKLAFPEKRGDKDNTGKTFETSLLSFDAEAAFIGLHNSIDLLSIQRAARKLTGLGLITAKLAGDWTREQQYAFMQSFVSPAAKRVVVFSPVTTKLDLSWLQCHQAALLFTRELINSTPEDLSPEVLVNKSIDWLRALSPKNVSIKTFVGEELVKAGYHGIYQVGRGSERPPVLLALDYNPLDSSHTDIALVGKGITFDSGGYSIKGSEGMLDMKCDMGGAATVTGALGLAIMQGLKKRVKLFLCCAENLISGDAYKLGDIIQYKNGVSVEIVNTDAEGRLVLADGLIAANDAQPSMIIDAATLTGAAVMAVGNDYNAVFSLNDTLCSQFLDICDATNEPHWRLPLTEAHQNKCPSPFADTANSRPQKGGGAGGASNAAGFLSRFAGDNKHAWLHIDLAAAYNRNGTDTMPEGGTAIGIRAISELLLV